ncbi:MAG: 4-hydroxy-tetrahydrodipicolinate reductase [Clostridia bacterium]|nr:4-hydroxy-tetrahydrodipicolinate reductase [Clostridia bacterium]
MLSVVVAGVTGRTGRAVAQAVSDAADLRLVGAVAPHHAGRRLGSVLGLEPAELVISASVDEALERAPADVLVDFTVPSAARENALAALARGCRPVVGTTGLSADDLAAIDAKARELGLAAVVAPNFSLGGLLLERLAREAARILPMVEIVELHHLHKKDQPSGTAARLARRLGEAGAREPVPIHSVRLPGLVAHHEVIFGGTGEVLAIRHDTTSREAFTPGVLVAVRSVARQAPGLVTDIWPLVAPE